MVLVKVPISVSALWFPIVGDPSTSGSVGISLTLEPFLIAEVRRGEGVKLNGEKVNIPNVEYLEKKLGKVSLDIYSRLPLGFGYGMSGAISLAYALGVSELSSVKREYAVEVAHESDVVSGNGLGDVVSELVGGVVCREEAGPPSRAIARRINVNDENLFTKIVEKLPTSSVISRVEWVPSAVREICSSPSIDQIFAYAKKFTESLGFYSPYKESYRKKGIIVKKGRLESGVWTVHRIAREGASVI